MVFRAGPATAVCVGIALLVALPVAFAFRVVAGMGKDDRPFFRHWYLKRITPVAIAIALFIGMVIDTIHLHNHGC